MAERLHLLNHRLDRVPTCGRRPPAPAPQAGPPAILAVDHAAFAPFWRLDEQGLLDALAATNTVRFRLAEHPDAPASWPATP